MLTCNKERLFESVQDSNVLNSAEVKDKHTDVQFRQTRKGSGQSIHSSHSLLHSTHRIQDSFWDFLVLVFFSSGLITEKVFANAALDTLVSGKFSEMQQPQ